MVGVVRMERPTRLLLDADHPPAQITVGQRPERGAYVDSKYISSAHHDDQTS